MALSREEVKRMASEILKRIEERRTLEGELLRTWSDYQLIRGIYKMKWRRIQGLHSLAMADYQAALDSNIPAKINRASAKLKFVNTKIELYEDLIESMDADYPLSLERERAKFAAKRKRQEDHHQETHSGLFALIEAIEIREGRCRKLY